jgi:4-alpha-glucanotransferase
MSSDADPAGAAHQRSSGILMHVTSLPGRHGIGDLGPGAYEFIEPLARARQTWWQMLPLGDGECPYQCSSAMAGNPNLISPDLLLKEGLLGAADLEYPDVAEGPIDFQEVTTLKNSLLARAWEQFQAGAAGHLHGEFEQFCQAEATWLDDYALFMALKAVHRGADWADWPRDIALRRKSALRDARRDLADDIGRRRFAQFLFFRQLDALRRHAHGLGVKLIGDLPIFVSRESSDVWSHPHLFQLDKNRRPKFVSGVPGDSYSPIGQRWGHPLYNWSAKKRDGFQWWIARARMALRQAEVVRIDHFTGFVACWTIPASAPTAETGRWVKTPGVDLFAALRAALGGLPFITEDLGVLATEAGALRDRFGLPGMRVLQFGFSGNSADPHLPHNYVRNSVVYTGTHDNDTTAGWYHALSRAERTRVRRYVPQVARDPAWAVMRLAWSSVADIAIATLQDVLRLGSEARMNVPGTPTGNWRWRVSGEMMNGANIGRLRQMTQTYGRVSNDRSKIL